MASFSSADGGMVMYQMPGEKSADGQQRENGPPVGMPPEYSAARSLHQLGGASHAAAASSARIDQLEAEVRRLRDALADKNAEAETLHRELQAALQIIEKHESSQQRPANPEPTAETDVPSHEESQETATAVSSQD